MKREYREINLEKFVPEEEEKLTKTEKEHIKKQFYESTGITTKGQQKKKQFKSNLKKWVKENRNTQFDEFMKALNKKLTGSDVSI